jgi:ABC-type bacteriocin/lantibiotic exporter with double-glycine peptidase domain
MDFFEHQYLSYLVFYFKFSILTTTFDFWNISLNMISIIILYVAVSQVIEPGNWVYKDKKIKKEKL